MPRKAHEPTTESRVEVRTLASPWRDREPIVYGLAGSDGKIVYVGATKHPRARLSYYRSNKSCHNERLSKWLSQNECFVHVLHRGENGMFDAERKEIKSRNGLFNLIAGGEQNWREHAQKPWMAGTGVLCPSAVALRMMKMGGNPCHRAHKAIFEARKAEMTDFERTLFEVNVAMQMPFCNRIKKWIDISGPRIVKCLEAA